MSALRVYLAGPDVFYPDAVQIGEAKKAICRKYGFEGRYPLDSLVGKPQWTTLKDSPIALATWIYTEARTMLESCDIVVANITPFRGPAADSGTVWEMGYAAGLGRPVHAYSTDPRPYHNKVADAVKTPTGLRDSRGWLVEDFGMIDNVMLDCSVQSSGGILIAKSETEPLLVFSTLMAELRRRHYHNKSGPPGRGSASAIDLTRD